MSIIQSWHREGYPANENKQNLSYNQMSFWHLGTVQHCPSVVKAVWFFTYYIIGTLNVNDDNVTSNHVIFIRFLPTV